MYNFQLSYRNQEKWSLQSAFSDPSWARSLRRHELSKTAMILHPPDWHGAFQTLPASFLARLFSFSTGLPVSECLLSICVRVASVIKCWTALILCQWWVYSGMLQPSFSPLSPLPPRAFFLLWIAQKQRRSSFLTFVLGGHPKPNPLAVCNFQCPNSLVGGIELTRWEVVNPAHCTNLRIHTWYSMTQK